MMAKKKIKLPKRFVFPGEKLSVIEEFLEGSGSYQIEGFVRSAELGEANFDLNKREVEVQKITKELVLPNEGLDVVGEVGSAMRRDAWVNVFIINGKEISKTYTGIIHISNIGNSRIRNINLALRNGDLVKAKIINTKNRIMQLSIEGAEYGVIYSYCSRCGALMEQQGGRLHCPKCDRVERRKFAKTYGKEELM